MHPRLSFDSKREKYQNDVMSLSTMNLATLSEYFLPGDLGLKGQWDSH